MTFTRRDFNLAALAVLAGAALPAGAQSLMAGRDYEPIQPPQPGETPGRIEVLEFFSYGCPHCKEFHPLVMAWAARLPRDVVFKRVPVSFGRVSWANLARLYYSLEAAGDLARLDDAVFRAIHEQRVNLFTDQAILAWVRSQGVAAERFAQMYGSFGVGVRLARGDQLVRNYKVEAVPLLTVAGAYKVTGQAARGLGDWLPIADGLIQLARGRRRP